MTIWKFELNELMGVNKVEMPKGAVALSVGEQRDSLVLWAIVDPIAEKETRSFGVCATGGGAPASGRFIGTVTLNLGYAHVAHVFEV